MTDHKEELDPLLAKALDQARRSFRVPADPPLDAMWKRIEDAHFAQGVHQGTVAQLQPRRGMRLRRWGALAATLLLGIAIGRFVPGTDGRVSQAATTSAETGLFAESLTAEPEIDPTMSVHLGQTAALLVALPVQQSNAEMTRALATRAAELLANTRVLLDSDAGSGQSVRALLEDLELVLTQIVRLHGGESEDLDLINQALEQRDVLPRLHLAVASIVTTE